MTTLGPTSVLRRLYRPAQPNHATRMHAVPPALGVAAAAFVVTSVLLSARGPVWPSARPAPPDPAAIVQAVATGPAGAGSRAAGAADGVDGAGTFPSPSGPPAATGTPAPAVASALAADGIPEVALRAYLAATASVGRTQPACRLPWELLAAIGRVESDHGRFAGAQPLADGTSSIKIIGIPLDGIGTALIRDTDGGRLDGDKVYDRAVGPMQFIPSTWARYGVDGNGDGKADPFNVFDAALSAAHYLCAAGGDLSTRVGQVRAVLAYNHSDAYLVTVLLLEQTYAGGGAVTVPGSLTSPPPGAVSLPPVNPGPPAGAGPPRHPPQSSPPAPHPSTAPSPTVPVSSGAPTSTAVQAPTSSSSVAVPASGCPSPTGTSTATSTSTATGTASGSTSATGTLTPSGTPTSPTPSDATTTTASSTPTDTGTPTTSPAPTTSVSDTSATESLSTSASVTTTATATPTCASGSANHPSAQASSSVPIAAFALALLVFAAFRAPFPGQARRARR